MCWTDWCSDSAVMAIGDGLLSWVPIVAAGSMYGWTFVAGELSPWAGIVCSCCCCLLCRKWLWLWPSWGWALASGSCLGCCQVLWASSCSLDWDSWRRIRRGVGCSWRSGCARPGSGVPRHCCCCSGAIWLRVYIQNSISLKRFLSILNRLSSYI